MLKKWGREESMGKASDADLGSVLGAVFLVFKICPAVTPEDGRGATYLLESSEFFSLLCFFAVLLRALFALFFLF